MSVQTRQMCAQEEAGIGAAFIRITYDDVSPFPVLTVEWQNTTDRPCFVAAIDVANRQPVAGMSATLAPGTALTSTNISGLGLHMTQVSKTFHGHPSTGLIPPFDCLLRWPA